jgi:hypothetical protein
MSEAEGEAGPNADALLPPLLPKEVLENDCVKLRFKEKRLAGQLSADCAAGEHERSMKENP